MVRARLPSVLGWLSAGKDRVVRWKYPPCGLFQQLIRLLTRMSCNATGAEARSGLTRPDSSSSSTAGSPGRRRSQRPAEGRVAEEDEDEPEDESEAGEGDEGDESEDEDTATVDGDAAVSPDPRGTTTFMLPSLFLNRPATVWIDYPNFTGEQRTEGAESIFELTNKRLLPLTFKSDRNINCITNCFKRVGFKRLLKGTSYNVYWGHTLNEKSFNKLAPGQLVNHFPGSYGIGRKDYLWKNLARMQRQFGAAYDFVAKSYLLPRDREYLERDWCDGDVFIVKPPAQAEGRGIRLINKLEQAPKGSTAALVQKYLGEPYLINNKKFDMRIYIGVTSFDPLRCYMFEEGLSRFATSDYKHVTNSNRKDRYMHLTNYSVNKKSSGYERNTDAEKDDEGSKWSLAATWKHLLEHGVDVPALQARIRDICLKTLISVEHSVVSKQLQMCHGRAQKSCFEVFGFDVLIDKDLKPWLIEVNVACSLASSSPLDKRIKNLLMTDMFHMLGVVPFDRRKIKAEEEEKRRSRLLRGNTAPLKHRNTHELQGRSLAEMPLSDLDVIIEAEDEYRRRGHWTRLFPCAGMRSYLTFFEFPRYSNTLLAKWFESPEWPLLTPHLNRAAWVAGYTPSVGAISLSQLQTKPDRSRTAASSRDAARDGISISGGGRSQPQDGGELVAREGTYIGTARPRSASRRDRERESPMPLRAAAAAEREGRQSNGGGAAREREGSSPQLNAVAYYGPPSPSPGGRMPGHTHMPAGPRRHSAAAAASLAGYEGVTRGPTHGVGVVRRASPLTLTLPHTLTRTPTPTGTPTPAPT